MKITVSTAKIILVILFLIGIITRFYNLNWDQNYFLHPDERNIGTAVWWLDWPKELNPHFFAYGSFPIYINFILGSLFNIINNARDWTIWDGAILVGRWMSALISVLLIPLSYKVTQIFSGKKNLSIPLLVAFFITSSVGLIQYAHFATFEIFLSFEYLLLFFVSIQLMECQASEKKKSIWLTIIMGLIFGIAMSTKITSLLLTPIPILAIIFSKSKLSVTPINMCLEKSSQIITFLLIAFPVYILTSPYNILDFSSFKYSIMYENAVASGVPVFFTAQFIDTIPVLFQQVNVFPWILNPLLSVLVIPVLLWLVIKCIKSENRLPYLFLFIISILLLAQSTLFVKWTRYMVPFLPLYYIAFSLCIHDVLKKVIPKMFPGIIIGLVLFSSLWCLSFFNIYLKTDTRIQMATWMSKNIPSNKKIFTEDLDQGYIPIKEKFPNLQIFNFYDLDGQNAKNVNSDLYIKLKENDYFVVLSRRVYANRFKNQNIFPYATDFYSKLFNEELNYILAYETKNPFSFFNISINDDTSEESFQVFDHPHLMIFKKINIVSN